MNKILTGLAVAVLLVACSNESEPVVPVVDIAAGKAIVETNCTGCHTLEGRGKTAEIPNLAAQPADYLVDAMNAYRNGTRHHSALQDLISGFNPADIGNIAGFFASLPPIQTEPDQATASSAYSRGAMVAAACIECHGERGFSSAPGVPSLAGQHPAYLIVATQEYANGSRGHAEKEAMLSGLGDLDIEKMAMYFAAQTPERRDPPPFGDVDAGEPLTAICGGCHGASGMGEDPLVPNLAGQEPTYLVNAIKAYRDLQRGHEGMITDQTDEEIENIAAFYSVQVAGSASDAGELANEVIAKCERCHGQAGGQSSLVVPSLKGQKQDYLLRVMREYRDGDRGSTMMHKMSAGYSDELLQEIAAYYASH